MNLSKLTNEELLELAKSKGVKPPSAEKPEISKLSNEELLALAKQKMAQKAEDEAPSVVESFIRGGAQTATLGLADELAGATSQSAQNEDLKKLGVRSFLQKEPFKPETYKEVRDAERLRNQLSQETNPKAYTAGEITGGIATTFLPGLAPAKAVKGASKLTAPISNIAKSITAGGTYGFGSSNSKDPSELVKDTLTGAGIGIIGGTGGELVGVLSNKLASSIENAAGRLAERATGATRTQAENFKAGTGQALLDKDIVKFGSSARSIQKRADAMMDEASNFIDSSLQKLDEMGIEVSPDEVMGAIQSKIDALKGKGGGLADQRRILEGIKEDIAESIGANPVKLSRVEQEKRSFRRVNWKDEDKAIARKEAYRALMDLVEEKATQADPEAAKVFQGAKYLYGLLSPVEDAAAKRAIQQNQHPLFGLNDLVSLGVGSGVGGAVDPNDPTSIGVGGIATMLGRRYIAGPRAASMAAVTAKKTAAAIPQAVTGTARSGIFQMTDSLNQHPDDLISQGMDILLKQKMMTGRARVPEIIRPLLRSEIEKKQSIGSIEKAKIINQLNKEGTVEDPQALRNHFSSTTQFQQPLYLKPPEPEEVIRGYRQKKREPY